MACYHPLLAIPTSEKTEKGKTKYKIEGKLDPREGKQLYPGSVAVPCGHCIGCRLDYSRKWADRMMLELETAKKGIFLTLTYDNAHIPGSIYEDFPEDEIVYFPYKGLERLDGDKAYWPTSFSLNKRDVQLFMKRLRRKFDGIKIRFYLAGEYGEKYHRPHYHAIVFGIGCDDIPDLREHGKNELGDTYYTSDLLYKTWSNGFVLLSDVSWKTCAYVARYVTKKLNGDYSIDYALRNCVPEFSLMSRKPGIGEPYLKAHPDALDLQNINISTPEGGRKIQLPKYYIDRLKFVPQKKNKVTGKIEEHPEDNPLYDPERYDIMMKERKDFADDAMYLKLQKTGLNYLDYLENVEEQNKIDSVKVLGRNKVE